MGRQRITTEVFINEAQSVHGDRYDYSEVVCPNNHTKVKILCKEHGIFEQSYQKHVSRNYNCPECRDEVKNTETFIIKSKQVHGDKYDYSKVLYYKSAEKVTIICPIHKEFNQVASYHLSGRGCQTCSGKGRTTEDIINIFKEIHGDKYGYSKVVFKNNTTSVILICNEHGEFKKTPEKIIHQKGGCNKCVGKGLTNDERISEAKKVHGDKYEYCKFNYVTAIKKTIVTCKNHGDFKVSPNDHINNETGCPTCRESKGEKLVTKILDNLNIQYKKQMRFDGCKGNSGSVKYSKRLPFDFYLPEVNVCIEYDGRQHSEPVWGIKSLEIQKSIDNIKNEFCTNNSIGLIRIHYKLNEDEIVTLINNTIHSLTTKEDS